jgi:hypothetical protein
VLWEILSGRAPFELEGDDTATDAAVVVAAADGATSTDCVYSCGVPKSVGDAILSGRLSGGDKQEAIRRAIVQGFRPIVPPSTPLPLATLLADAWAATAQQRPSAAALEERLFAHAHGITSFQSCS